MRPVEELPAIIQEILEPATPDDAATEPHVVVSTDAGANITDADVDAVLEQESLQSLAALGFDADELLELESVDPLEQDVSDDPLVQLDVTDLG